jgi:phosphoribosylaminoimidazole-succinocarboxamide synthase
MSTKLYEGKAKQIYRTNNPNQVIVHYKDDATAGNGAKKASINNKGILNNTMVCIIYTMLNKHKIPTHFIKQLNDRDQLCKKVKIIPLEVIIRNVVAGSLAARYGAVEGQKLKTPTIEFSYKNDKLNDPLINDYQAVGLGFATFGEIKTITNYAFQINKILIKYFKKMGIKLIDFKLEFGKDASGKILLADEISPDTCRL